MASPAPRARLRPLVRLVPRHATRDAGGGARGVAVAERGARARVGAVGSRRAGSPASPAAGRASGEEVARRGRLFRARRVAGERGRARRRRHLLARVAGRWSARVVSRAFDGWFEEAAARARARSVAEKLARRWRQTAVSKAFDKWRAESAFAASTRGMLARRAASGFQKRAMAAGFVRWAAVATERVALRRRLSKIVARMATATCRRAWEGWIDRIERRARALASLEAAIARWTRRALVASFRAWFARCGELRAARSAAAKALGAWRSRSLFRCFRRWTEFASQRAKLVTMLDRIVARWARRRSRRRSTDGTRRRRSVDGFAGCSAKFAPRRFKIQSPEPSPRGFRTLAGAEPREPS